MNRIATWILGSISGLLLCLGILALTTFGIGYGASSGCVSADVQPCTPILQQVTVFWPDFIGPEAIAFAMLALALLIGLPAWIATPLLAMRRGSSARLVILVVAAVSTALLITFCTIITTADATVFQAPRVCADALGYGAMGYGPQGQTCYTGDQAFWVALIGIAWTPLAMSLLAGAPAWVMTLTQTARRGQWGWFVAAFFLSPVAALLYALFGDRRPASPAPVAPMAPASPAPAAG